MGITCKWKHKTGSMARIQHSMLLVFRVSGSKPFTFIARYSRFVQVTHSENLSSNYSKYGQCKDVKKEDAAD